MRLRYYVLVSSWVCCNGACLVPFLVTVSGFFLSEYELRSVVCNFELISTSYEDSTLIISFVLRTSKG